MIKLIKGNVELTENSGVYNVKYNNPLELNLRNPSKESEFTLEVEDYEVLKVESSCNCAASKNDNGLINFTFKPKKEGYFKKLSTIICKNRNNDVIYIDLNISGYAE